MPHVNRLCGLYPGTFDMPTNGHLNMIERAAHLFGRLYVAVANNTSKRPLLTVEERQELLRAITDNIANVEVVAFDGLTVQYARDIGAKAIVRGLRAVSDFEYELQMAHMNQQMAPDIETIYLSPAIETTFLSSSTIREVFRLGGDISPFVPAQVVQFMREKRARGEFPPHFLIPR